MSRALRKAQKQKLRASDLKPASEEEGSDEEDETPRTSSVPNPFDLLNAGHNDDNPTSPSPPISDDEVLSKDEQEDIETALIASTTELLEAPKPKRKAKGKRKKKSKTHDAQVGTPIDDAGTDDKFDAILKQHNDALSKVSPDQTETQAFHKKDLLVIDVRMLDPESEMRRIFGSRVISEEKSERSSRRQPRGMVPLKNRGRKTVLVPMEDAYPLNINSGLEMEMLPSSTDGEKCFQFVHSKAYQKTQYMFLQCVQSGDPQTLMNLLSRAPFHIDTLLQVSEIMRHQGDNEGSLEMLTRALFVFDRALHPLFNIATGSVRLPFKYTENRPFFLAIYRYIQSLGRRGCWATAFEFNKLLLALAPEDDPYAALLSIDFYAIKARRWDYIDLLARVRWESVLKDESLMNNNFAKPNFDYAQALSKVLRSSNQADQEPAKSLLGSAIKNFPYFVGALFTELKAVGPIQYDTLQPTSQFAALLRDLYAFRCKDVYNTPELTKFLRESAVAVETFDPYEFSEEIPLNVCRHVLLLDERTLLHHLPNNIKQASGPSYDPLTPSDSMRSYLDDPPFALLGQASENTESRSSILPRFLEDLLRRGLGAVADNTRAGPQLNDEEVAQMFQAMEFDDDQEGGPGGPNFADPNGYGVNRGVDEPEGEGNAGRR